MKRTFLSLLELPIGHEEGGHTKLTKLMWPLKAHFALRFNLMPRYMDGSPQQIMARPKDHKCHTCGGLREDFACFEVKDDHVVFSDGAYHESWVKDAKLTLDKFVARDFNYNNQPQEK